MLTSENKHLRQTPVSESKAPVGSPHKTICGFFASTLAIETRCCSPPDIWLGKLSILLSCPTRLSISLASSGSEQISSASWKRLHQPPETDVYNNI